MAVVHLNLSPSEFRALTMTEWNALVAEFNKAHKHK